MGFKFFHRILEFRLFYNNPSEFSLNFRNNVRVGPLTVLIINAFCLLGANSGTHLKTSYLLAFEIYVQKQTPQLLRAFMRSTGSSWKSFEMIVK